MTPYAAVASVACPTLALITLGYLAACLAFPFTNCRRCFGSGKLRSPIGRSFRLCRRCDGTGLELRIGRRVINHIRDEYRQGNG